MFFPLTGVYNSILSVPSCGQQVVLLHNGGTVAGHTLESRKFSFKSKTYYTCTLQNSKPTLWMSLIDDRQLVRSWNLTDVPAVRMCAWQRDMMSKKIRCHRFHCDVLSMSQVLLPNPHRSKPTTMSSDEQTLLHVLPRDQDWSSILPRLNTFTFDQQDLISLLDR